MRFSELFEIKYAGRLLGVARTGSHNGRCYVGLVNGKIVAIASGKGDLVRNLMEIAKTHAKAPDGVRTYFSYGKRYASNTRRIETDLGSAAPDASRAKGEHIDV